MGKYDKFQIKTNEQYKYPSRYGSHQSMVVKEDGLVVTLQDEFGEYQTTKDRLDNKLADPNRFDLQARGVGLK